MSCNPCDPLSKVGNVIEVDVAMWPAVKSQCKGLDRLLATSLSTGHTDDLWPVPCSFSHGPVELLLVAAGAVGLFSLCCSGIKHLAHYCNSCIAHVSDMPNWHQMCSFGEIVLDKVVVQYFT